MKYLLPILCIFCLSKALFAQSDKIYGINFAANGLKLSSLNITTGEVEIISQNVLSPDAFQQGVSDFDPIGKRYFYVRGSGNSSEIFTVDGITGQTISSPTMVVENPALGNSVIGITNIAYNWLDDVLYGMNHNYIGSEHLRLCKVDLTTGVITLISDQPVSTEPYLSGNSDIDPINRRYFYATPNNIYTVDLDTGEPINNVAINYPLTGTQTTANLTYDWQNDIIYCLHFLSAPAELRLATIDPINGNMELISQNITSTDGFSMGDCDIDPVGNRYFYIRQNVLYIVSLSDGTVMQTIPIENLNNAVVPIINMSYDDLTNDAPTLLSLDLGDTTEISIGNAIELNAWVGDEATYLWQDGNTAAIRSITTPGDYSVTITRDDFTIQGSVTVEMENTTAINWIDADLRIEISPNPASDFVVYKIKSMNAIDGQLSLLDLNGKVLWSKVIQKGNGTIGVRTLPAGTYVLNYQADGFQMSKLIVVLDH